MSLTDDMLDLTSVKGEYLRLYSKEVLKAIDKMLDRINGKTDITLETIVTETALRIYDISNADFEEPNEESR